MFVACSARQATRPEVSCKGQEVDRWVFKADAGEVVGVGTDKVILGFHKTFKDVVALVVHQDQRYWKALMCSSSEIYGESRAEPSPIIVTN